MSGYENASSILRLLLCSSLALTHSLGLQPSRYLISQRFPLTLTTIAKFQEPSHWSTYVTISPTSIKEKQAKNQICYYFLSNLENAPTSSSKSIIHWGNLSVLSYNENFLNNQCYLFNFNNSFDKWMQRKVFDQNVTIDNFPLKVWSKVATVFKSGKSLFICS